MKVEEVAIAVGVQGAVDLTVVVVDPSGQDRIVVRGFTLDLTGDLVLCVPRLRNDTLRRVWLRIWDIFTRRGGRYD